MSWETLTVRGDMGGRCTFGLFYMHCASAGPITWTLGGLLFACVMSMILLAFLIDWALFKRHPNEHKDIRLSVVTAYKFYAWRRRGRELGDDGLAKLLDKYRLLQMTTYALFALIGLSMYFGL